MAYPYGHPVGGAVWFDVGKEVFRPRLGLGLSDRLIDDLMNFEKSVPMLGSTFGHLKENWKGRLAYW